MASSAGNTRRVLRLAGPALLPAVVYGAYKANAVGAVKAFLTGPGRTSRIVALAVILFNWKSLPLAWTFRVWHTMISHFLVRQYHAHTPDKLFHPSITSTHVSLLEVDYNIHKSNSTYFADLDVSRSHLVCHLFARGCDALAKNAATKLVPDPADLVRPARGRFGVMLGAVHCSFRREIAPYQGYEIWTRLLSWDRKWVYMVSHFVEKGAIKPRSWDTSGFGIGSTRATEGKPEEWEKKIFATAVSKYVFKIGRLTVHPAVLIEASGLLPERPGGWTSTENGVATSLNGAANSLNESSVWDWKRTEAERVRGMEFTQHFAALDGLHSRFDGGEDGALGRFALG
ncbi:capsule polysaccharide biosynthesis protein [Xylariaceae sp. FL0016]|nr:capsule polysaccharide biosynthesis protein [Xylariaceae sp. FL0016]